MCPELPHWLKPGAFALLEILSPAQTDMLCLSGALSLYGGGTILDGGNHFNAYRVVEYVRFYSTDLDRLDSLAVARAFNCHQMAELVRHIPHNGRPCLAIDFLDTFQDDAISLGQRARLVELAVRQLDQISRRQAVVVSLRAPRESIDEWNQLANPFRRRASIKLEEGFMGKTIPTVNQIVQQAEVILARFSRITQPEERAALEELFVSARKHIAAISEANHLIPFEVAQQAMLVEQQKIILDLQKRIAALEQRLGL